MSIMTISPKELATKCLQGDAVDIIDVRTPVEYREIHCPQAKNVPLSELDPQKIMSARTNKNEPLYVICRSGSRGQKACEQFVAAGFTNVINVDGGTLAWANSGLPVKQGKKAISLERQVRIVAGSLVFIGAALGYFVDSAFIGIPAFIGAGLVFAGVTDTCGMGMLLARMPWNQVSSPSGPTCSN